MKGAIATVDFFVRHAEEEPVRLSLVIAAPERDSASGVWRCRIALADRQRPKTLEGRDSAEVLMLAVDQARSWIGKLRAQGRVLTRDRAGEIPFELS